ncbi:MAG: hypothetical protein IM674_03370 [Brevundimonas sp.]|nr:hypothetical protein [Brevundimonas sp.]
MARPSSSPSPVLAHAAALAAALAAPLAAQHEQGAADPNAPMYVAPRSADAQEAIAGFQLAETLVCDLVASEPDLANPVAFGTHLTSAWCFSKTNEDIGAPMPSARLRNLFISRQQFVQLIQKE